MPLEELVGAIVAEPVDISMTWVAGVAGGHDHIHLPRRVVVRLRLKNGRIERPEYHRLGETMRVVCVDVSTDAVPGTVFASAFSLDHRDAQPPVRCRYLSVFVETGAASSGVLECNIGDTWFDEVEMKWTDEARECHSGLLTRSRSLEYTSS